MTFGPPRSTPRRAGAARIRPLVVACALAAVAFAGGPAPVVRAQGTLSAIQADVDAISRHARPSVVTVIAQRAVSTPALRAGQPPTSRLHSRVGSGVAVAINEVVTTASVVLGAEKLVVVTENGISVDARLVGMDPVRNVALLRVDGVELPPIVLADRPASLGDWVIALGVSYRGQPTQSVGNVSYRFREPRLSLLQLTNDVYPGNSGGAALDTHGNLVGLVQGELGAPESGTSPNEGDHRPTGLSIVVPVEDVAAVLRDVRRDGRAHLGYMGVSTRAGNVESASQPGERVPLGAIVEAYVPGGPAERLGLRKGDLIVAFEGERVEYPEQLARWVAATPPGTIVSVVWARNDMRHAGRVALGESPTPIPAWMMPTVGAAAPANAHVAELEARIRRLNRELVRLRGQQQDSMR